MAVAHLRIIHNYSTDIAAHLLLSHCSFTLLLPGKKYRLWSCIWNKKQLLTSGCEPSGKNENQIWNTPVTKDGLLYHIVFVWIQLYQNSPKRWKVICILIGKPVWNQSESTPPHTHTVLTGIPCKDRRKLVCIKVTHNASQSSTYGVTST